MLFFLCNPRLNGWLVSVRVLIVLNCMTGTSQCSRSQSTMEPKCGAEGNTASEGLKLQVRQIANELAAGSLSAGHL